MKSFYGVYLITIAIYIVAALANRLGGANGFGSGSANSHHVDGSNHKGLVGAHGNASPGNKHSGHESSKANNNIHGSLASHNHGQGNAHGSNGVHSIVNAIQVANQQTRTVNRAIRSVRAGGTIEHLDLALQSLSATIKTASTAITSARSLHDDDFQTIHSSIQPFHQSIGSLVTQLVGRRDTIAGLCGCRPIQGAVNHIRISTRAMFDGIKNHLSHGGPFHGRHGFGGFHSLDSGIASFLNHGYNSFGFGNCIDFGNIPSGLTTYTIQTSTWAPSTITDFSTVTDISTITDFTTVYSTSTNIYTSYAYASPTTRGSSYYTRGGGYQATNAPSSFGYGGDSESSNIYGRQHVDN
ncbi:hypothetical protein K445DRAFT_24263 [Daldinia sp. EC12]|nr:hypothetical protein K445DRAFT_24263 [Daldinia sp. EC12]